MNIHHLDRQGLKKARIARRLGIDRKTVAKYLKHPEGPPSIRRADSSILDPYKQYLEYRLKNYPDLTAARLYREIQGMEFEDPEGILPPKPYEGSERTVRRYVSRLRPRGSQRQHRPIETLPGEEAQVDWGHAGYIQIDGKRKPLYVFSLVLSYSRIRYVRFTTSQDMLTFLDCHQRSLQYIGGVPERILYDNCKTVVSDRVGSVIAFNQDLLRFATRYCFKPQACWIYDPESKGKVENSIGYVKRDFFYAREITDLKTLNDQALAWCDQVANEKTHSSIREIPSARLAEERRALAPLPSHPVPVFIETDRWVRKDGTISFETNHYSVPATYSRSKVRLMVFSDRLEVYSYEQRVARHSRCHDRGQLILEDDHYTDRPLGPRKRRSQMQVEFESLGPEAASYLRGLARSRRGGLRDQVKAILALRENYPVEAIHQAMERAGAFEKFSYGTLKNILEKQACDPRSLPGDPREKKVSGEYQGLTIEVQVRSPEDYAQLLEVGN